LRDDQEVLDRWSAGDIDADALMSEVGWYDRGGYRFEYYEPVMEAARAHGVRIVGLNVPREIPRAVNRGGLDALDDEQKREVGDVRTDDSPGHRYLIGRYFGETVAMLPPGWFENMYAAQCLWDVVMARSILANLDPGETMMVIVGSGHVAYDLGIPRRIHEELEASGAADIRVASFCPITAPQADPGDDPHGHPMGGHGKGMEASASKPARFVRSLADFVGAFPDTGGIEAFPTVGLRLDEADDGVPVVSMAWPDTPAAAVGFEHGDRILSFNGRRPPNVTELRLMLARISWGQRVEFEVAREEERLTIPLLLYPRVDLTQEETAPGYTLAPTGDFDPSSPAAVVADSAATERRRSVLVSEDSTPTRIELWRGEVLDEVHELDSSERVARSLYRLPLPDGAVEIRYQRNQDGAVVATTRHDGRGQELDPS
jgi:hypothetical protein